MAAVDYNPEKLEKVVSDLKAEGRHAEAFPADVRDSAAIDEITARIEREMGPIDILVNVAGVLRPGLIHSLSDEEWEATFSVNSTGVFNASRSVSKYMMDRRSGSIVTVGSNACRCTKNIYGGICVFKGHAAVMFTKCLGLELAEYNIRRNIVSPGSTETDMQWSLWADENGAEQVIKGSLETFKTGIPLKKLAKPSDIADAVLFLVSGQAGHITMHNLCVDGGATLGV
nr:2,3-dihydro-2,3-dihydroxybenzoate dehydrogenase [Bacillus subtilis]